MARPGSVAVGGYFPAQVELIPSIAALARPIIADKTEHAVLDPCAGEGQAIFGLAAQWFGEKADGWNLYACEMEKTRFDELQKNKWYHLKSYLGEILHGDAFRIQWEEEYGRGAGMTIAWLNPPYDHDRELGRVEERWLRRFTPALAVGGALLFYVPFYALSASATTLATHFESLSCWRVPEPHFSVFKQVVLVARRRPALLAPDAAVETQVRAWAADASAIPEVPPAGPPALEVCGLKEHTAGFSKWELAPLDIRGILAEVGPWQRSERSGRVSTIYGIVPEEPFGELLSPRFPVAMPPRAAHVAAGIASGVLSGAELEPDLNGAPPIIVKGVFRKEFVKVDSKTNKDGEKVGEIQAQKPRLEIVALDLKTSTYHTLRPELEPSGGTDPAAFTAGDLLASYGRSLLSTLRDRCPALHDPSKPSHAFELPRFKRPLFTAHEHAVRACLRLVREPDQAAIVLGEIGVGKSSTALATAAAYGARRVLIMCPPHLLRSWADQAAAVVPEARVVVLEDVGHVDALARRSRGMIIAILSRETAKLGHRWAGVTGRCPRCAAELPAGPDELASKRMRCEARGVVARSWLGYLVLRLAQALVPVGKGNGTLDKLVQGRVARRCRRDVGALPNLAPFVRRIVRGLRTAQDEPSAQLVTGLLLLLLAANSDALTCESARLLFAESTRREEHVIASRLRDTAIKIAFLLPTGSEAQTKLLGEFRSKYSESYLWNDVDQHVGHLSGNGSPASWRWKGIKRNKEGRLAIDEREAGTSAAALHALDLLAPIAGLRYSAECDEPLYQAIPKPRSYPLAHYIRKRHPKLFDFLVIDEGHEYANTDTAQSLAAQQLMGLRIPKLLLTGSVMNGYAESLFTLLWATSSKFRAEFGREERGEFVRRYGYLKQVVEYRDKETKKPVEFGTVTDRVERVERTQGQAPGVLPVLLLRHLLPIAVTLQISDLEVELPEPREIVEEIEPDPELLGRFKALQASLVNQMKRDRFSELAGRLFGQLAELPSYLDRATDDVGNCESGAFEIRYPEDVGGHLVASFPGFPTDRLLPKEEWLINVVRRELAEDRNVMILVWHLELLPRISRLLEQHTGERAPILFANKVAPRDREEWINREIVGKGRRLLLCNPVAVKTGLNNLIHFCTQIWIENPACNPEIRRQAIGRIRRIGQKKETRVYSPLYAGTLQVAAHQLLMHKVAVSLAADGLDAAEAFRAAGIGGEEDVAAGDLGRVLYRMLTEREEE